MRAFLLTSVFHHDSPYDACSPRVNQTKNRKAPIRAFETTADTENQEVPKEPIKFEQGIVDEDPDYGGGGPMDTLFNNSAVVQLGYNRPTDGTNPNNDVFGVEKEPSSRRDQPLMRSATTARPYNTYNPSLVLQEEGADMETILRGGRRVNETEAAPSAPTNALENIDADVESNRRNRSSRKSGLSRATSLGRSKSMLSRFRLFRMNDEEVPSSSQHISAPSSSAPRADGVSKSVHESPRLQESSRGTYTKIATQPLAEEPSSSRRGYTFAQEAAPPLPPKSVALGGLGPVSDSTYGT